MFKPDGFNLTTRTLGTNGGSFTVSLPATGTYTLVVDPQYGKTGGITLRLTQPAAALNLSDLGPLLPDEADVPR